MAARAPRDDSGVRAPVSKTPFPVKPRVPFAIQRPRFETRSSSENEESRSSFGKVAILIVVAIFGLAAYYFSDSGDPVSDKINLIAPGKPSTPLSDIEVKKRYNDILRLIEH